MAAVEEMPTVGRNSRAMRAPGGAGPIVCPHHLPFCMTCGPEHQHANLSQIGLPSQENNVPKPLECVKWSL